MEAAHFQELHRKGFCRRLLIDKALEFIRWDLMDQREILRVLHLNGHHAPSKPRGCNGTKPRRQCL